MSLGLSEYLMLWGLSEYVLSLGLSDYEISLGLSDYETSWGLSEYENNRKAMNRNWSNQKENPALKTKAGFYRCRMD